jgi:hypothetical protein
MEDDKRPPETYKAQIARRRTKASLVVLRYWQRLGVGLVVVIILLIVGGLAAGFFNHTP